jgi:8-hydroxy-5-deazaflavin:NADPH oxidoreductase
MRVAILGSGLMGGKLGTLFVRAGHDVVFSYARSRKKLQRLADEAGAGARAGTPAEAVTGADAILLAVHWSRVDDVLAQAGKLSRKTVLTCSLPMSKDDSRLVLGLSKSGAEALAAKVPGAHVVSAFGTVPSEALFPVFERRRRQTRPDLVYCGDHRGAKRTAARLIRDLGFHPVDLGALSAARYVEPFALLLAEIAYGGPAGPDLTYRFERTRGRRKRR